MVGRQTRPEQVPASPVARRELGRLLPLTVLLSPCPPPWAVVTPPRISVDPVVAVIFVGADGGSARIVVIGGGGEAGEHVDGTGT